MRTDDLFSAFVQDNISIIPDRLTFEAGTKILHTDFTGVELGTKRPAAVDSHRDRDVLGRCDPRGSHSL